MLRGSPGGRVTVTVIGLRSARQWCRALHQEHREGLAGVADLDGPRSRDLDALGAEGEQETPPVLTPHGPLLNGQRLEAGLDHHARVLEGVHPEDLDWLEDQLAVCGILPQLLVHAPHELY